MVHALVPGSFDPITNGHRDIILRASSLFKTVSIGIVINPNKTGLFSIEERKKLIVEVFSDTPNIRVTTVPGLLVHYVQKNNIDVLVKGLRSPNDFAYELSMDHMNNHLAQIQTVYLATHPEWTFVSSSLIKEIAQLGGDISGLVPRNITHAVINKLHPK